jgi:hypothetical protein
MAWETRHQNKSYYYRARKLNGRVVKTYIGTGPLAEELAEADARERQERLQRAADRKRRHDELSAVDMPLELFADAVESLTRASLVDAGYHFHRSSEWRKRRHG